MTSSQQDPNERSALLARIESLHAVDNLESTRFLAGGRMRVQSAVDEAAARRTVTQIVMLGAQAAIEPSRTVEDLLQALDGEEPEAAPAPSAPPPVVAPIAAGDDDERFRPTGAWQQPMHLELERPAAPPPPPRAPSPVADEDAAPARVAERVVDEPEWRPVPGRIAQGALRKQPPVRIAVGVVLGLFLGWMFAQPYAHRAERRVAELRADADRERYRPVDEAQARVRALDREADDTASNGALGMGFIWIVVGGAAFAGWWRVT